MTCLFVEQTVLIVLLWEHRDLSMNVSTLSTRTRVRCIFVCISFLTREFTEIHPNRQSFAQGCSTKVGVVLQAKLALYVCQIANELTYESML
jgi:hypothetical protein